MRLEWSSGVRNRRSKVDYDYNAFFTFDLLNKFGKIKLIGLGRSELARKKVFSFEFRKAAMTMAKIMKQVQFFPGNRNIVGR